MIIPLCRKTACSPKNASPPSHAAELTVDAPRGEDGRHLVLDFMAGDDVRDEFVCVCVAIGTEGAGVHAGTRVNGGLV